MRLALLGVGTRGDVQPLLSLAWELKQRGHSVRLALPDLFVPGLLAAGLDAVPLGIDVEAMLNSDVGKKALANGDMLSFLKLLVDGERRASATMGDVIQDVCADAEGIVCTTLLTDRAAAVSEARRVPLVAQHVFPAPPTAAWAYPLLPMQSLGLDWLNRLVGVALMRATHAPVRPDIDAFRARYGLPKHGPSTLERNDAPGLTTLLAFSGHVVPRAPDWHDRIHVTGWCDVPDGLRRALGEAPDPALEAWLAEGPPPVFFGFGSMPVLDPEKLFRGVRAVVRDLGVRALVGAGWSRFARVEDKDIFVSPRFDHASVLPRCRAAVHHGGSHTTYASLRAGLPTHIAAVMADQPYWGSRLVHLGVGTTSPFKKLDEAALQRAVTGLLSPERRAAAAALAEKLRQDDGLGATIRHVEAMAR